MKSFVRTIVVLVVTLALVVPVLGASAKADPVEIQVWLLTDDAQFFEEELIPAFNEANPDVKAVYTGHSTDAHKDVLRQVINTDAAPDVFFTWGGAGLYGYYIDTGGVEDLTTTYEENGWLDRFPAAGVEGAKWGEGIYGTPYYRKDLFEKAGITAEPTTYEELVAVNEKLVEAGLIPLASGGKQSWMPMRLLDSLFELKCGAAKHDDLKYMRVNWTEEPCATEAFVEFQRWVDEWLPKDFLGIEPEVGSHMLVNTGQAAMYYEGNWVVPRFEGEGMKPEDFGFFYFPTDTNRASWFAEFLCISSTSQHKPEAIRFLDWISSPEVQATYAEWWGGIIPTVGVALPEGSPELLIEINDLLAQAEGIYLPADQSLPLQVVTEGYWLAQDKIIVGELDPAEGAATVQASIDKYLEANP